MKYYVLIISVFLFWSCDSSRPEEINFSGFWIEKSIAKDFFSKNNGSENKDLPVPLIHFREDNLDSISFFIKPDSIEKFPALFRFHSYYINLGAENESLILYDYQTSEIIFKDLIHKKVYKYQKIKPHSDSLIFQNLRQYFKNDLFLY